MTTTEQAKPKTTKTADLQGACVLLHGPPKVGKTTLASSFPGPRFWAATEAGHRFLDDTNEVHMVKTWAEFTNAISIPLVKEDAYQTVVIDEVAKLYDMCMLHVSKQHKVLHPNDLDHGKGWAAVKSEFSDILNRIHRACAEKNKTLIFICHTQTDKIDTRVEQWTRQSLALTGQAHKILTPIPDYIFHYTYGTAGSHALEKQAGPRVLWVGGNNAIEAGTRDPQVKVSAIENVPQTGQYEFVCNNLYNEGTK